MDEKLKNILGIIDSIHDFYDVDISTEKSNKPLLDLFRNFYINTLNDDITEYKDILKETELSFIFDDSKPIFV
jgi:hypothetical protein